MATGVTDELPDIPNLRERWGIDVIHCPYCHGWEVRDTRIGVIATGPMAVHQAMLFRQLSDTVTLFVHAGDGPTAEEAERLHARGISVVPGPVTEVVVTSDQPGGRVSGLRVGDDTFPVDNVVVGPRMVVHSPVLESLGLEPVDHPMGGAVGTTYEASPTGQTAVAGVWAAGNVVDISASVVNVVGAGYLAGAMINADLANDDTDRALAAHAAHSHDVPVMDEAFWDARYGTADRIWSGKPNPQLVADTAELAPGRALDVGAGEGADAIWLAERGWTVDALDISGVALERGRDEAVRSRGRRGRPDHLAARRRAERRTPRRSVRPRVAAVHALLEGRSHLPVPSLHRGRRSRRHVAGRRAPSPRPPHHRPPAEDAGLLLRRRRGRRTARRRMDRRRLRRPAPHGDRPRRRRCRSTTPSWSPAGHSVAGVTPTTEVELHPWNDGFEWADHRGPTRRLTAEQVAQFDELGFVVLEGVFTDDELAPVIAATDALDAATDRFLAERDGGRFSIAERGAITFSLFPVLADDAARAFAAHQVFTDLCHDLVGPDVRLYHDQAVYKQPEKPRRFPWHQDNGYTFVEPQQYLTCWVALTDATLDNGCPHIVPGLHRLGTLRHHFTDPLGWEIFEDHPDAIAAPVGKGGVVVFSSLSPHLTGPNTTGATRKAYILQYAPDGAQVFHGDAALPKPEPERADDPARQFPVLVAGEPVAPPPR